MVEGGGLEAGHLRGGGEEVGIEKSWLVGERVHFSSSLFEG